MISHLKMLLSGLYLLVLLIQYGLESAEKKNYWVGKDRWFPSQVYVFYQKATAHIEVKICSARK